MNNPLISIIIPTYNRAHIIRETLDSILIQSYQNWECIIVDDGSSDNTDEVLKEYQTSDNRFQFHKRPSEYNSGANGARNFGFKISKGEYINWFDSDDLMLKDFLEIKIKKALTENADVVISKRFENGKFLDYKCLDAGIYEKNDFDREYIINRYSILTGDVLFSRNVINQTFDENLYKAQEMEFFTRIFRQNLIIAFVDKFLWNHRIFIDSISSRSNKNKDRKIESLVYLSKKLQKKYILDFEVLKVVKNYGVVLYKSLMINSEYILLFRFYNFFRKCYNLNFILFSLFFSYNFFSKKGFDLLKRVGKKKFNKKTKF